MTREEIEKQYTVQNGRIKSPGKFEGEMLYVPYFWDEYLNGGADSDNGKVLTFRLNDQDRKMFPEIPSRRRVIRIQEMDTGFVCEV